MVGGVEHVENRMTRGNPNRLLTLKIATRRREQVVFLAYGTPDGECDNFYLCVETHGELDKGNKLETGV